MGSPVLSPLLARWAALAAGAALTALAFPGPWSADGWGFVVWFSLVPVFWFIRKARWPELLAGAFFYALVFSLLAFGWLGGFHPLALPITALVFFAGILLLFPLLKLAVTAFPRRGFWLQAGLWTAWEYLRTQGFLGFSYGGLASASAFYPVLIQSAEWTGIWGLTFLTAATNAVLAALLVPEQRYKLIPDGVVAAVLFLGNLVWGWAVLAAPLSPGRLWHPVLVQHVQDPWKGGGFAYEEGLDKLLALSGQAEESRPEAVIWSETAFVPSVFFHEKYRENPDSYRLVRRLEDFLQTRKIPYLLGNDHREKVVREGRERVADWNAVLYWNGGWQGVYRKNRLVPFTESFPYKETFPWVYKLLLDNDTHFWEPGSGFDLFDLNGVKVGTPVCFEDAFPDLPRQMTAAGAQVIVNLTNDSWAASTAAMRQHLALSVFRAVENRRSLVRSSNGGSTAAVSPRGQILDRLEEWKPGILQAAVPVSNEKTLYTAAGDWAAVFFVIFAVTGSLTGIYFVLRRRSRPEKR